MILPPLSVKLDQLHTTLLMAPYKLTVLMYHALFDCAGRCEGADPYYTVTSQVFLRHLAMIKAAGLQASSVADILAFGSHTGRIAITFDDGHASNLAAAMAIVESGGRADLFINPESVGKHNYLDWSALSDLAKAGISIQSHGQTHRYFDELSARDVEYELAVSKSNIEDRIGTLVTLFAPPGGRLTWRVAPIAKRLGYLGICSSRVGLWRVDGARWSIPRLAVLESTTDAQLLGWVTQDRWEIAKLEVRHLVLTVAKRLLGNRSYERMRAGMLGRSDMSESPP